LTQSGYWNPMTPFVERALANASLRGDDGLMVTNFSLQGEPENYRGDSHRDSRPQYISYTLDVNGSRPSPDLHSFAQPAGKRR
jgi:hypothetical protein